MSLHKVTVFFTFLLLSERDGRTGKLALKSHIFKTCLSFLGEILWALLLGNMDGLQNV